MEMESEPFRKFLKKGSSNGLPGPSWYSCRLADGGGGGGG